MDTIKINNLEIFSNHGVFKEENILGQKFIVSAELKLDTRAAGNSDDLELSVNYAEICLLIKDITENNTYSLIETLAEKICESVLLNYSSVEEIKVEVKKPCAPSMLSLEDVSVSIRRKWHTVYLSLGSNMGDREKYITDALSFIASDKRCKDIKNSGMIETAPYGVTDQAPFLNCCTELKTLCYPHELHELTSKAEENAARERKIRWGPRTLDVDIILYDDLILHDKTLTIPHIDMHNREFVLEPLVELNPYAIHPVLQKSALSMLQELKNK